MRVPPVRRVTRLCRGWWALGGALRPKEAYQSRRGAAGSYGGWGHWEWASRPRKKYRSRRSESKARSRGGPWDRIGGQDVGCDRASTDRERRSESGAALPLDGVAWKRRGRTKENGRRNRKKKKKNWEGGGVGRPGFGLVWTRPKGCPSSARKLNGL